MAASLIALVAAAPALAQQVVELSPLTIPGALAPLAADPAGSSVTTLDRATIAQGGPLLAEGLARLPGFSLASQGAFGDFASTLRVRGLDAGYVAVLVDGIPVGDPTSTKVGFDFGRLLGAGTSRVEVLRGSQSAHWGGSAVAGVIAISTLDGIEDGLHQTATAELGTYQTAALSYGLTRKTGQAELAFNLSHFRTGGFSAFDGGSEPDGGEATRISFSGRYAISETLSLGGALFAQRSQHDFDGYPPPLYAFADTDAQTTRRELGARLFAEAELGDSQHLFEMATYHTKRETTDDFGYSEFRGQTLRLGWRGTTPLGEALTLVYGADWTREQARTDALAGTVRSDVTGAWVQGVWSTGPDFQIAATVRHDRNSDFGDFTTGKLALAWHPDADSTLRAALGTGFRAPSIDERYGAYPAFGLAGNPDLTPETSRSFELGYDRQFAGGATLSATVFRLETDDRISMTDDWSTLENKSGESVSQGLELAATAPLAEGYTLGLAYTYTDTRTPAGGRFTGVPRHDLTLSLDGQFSRRLSGGVQLQHVADRPLDQGTPMPDYTLVSARVAYALTDGSEAYLRVENLGDVHYQTSAGYGQPGRSLFLGIGVRF